MIHISAIFDEFHVATECGACEYCGFKRRTFIAIVATVCDCNQSNIYIDVDVESVTCHILLQCVKALHVASGNHTYY